MNQSLLLYLSLAITSSISLVGCGFMVFLFVYYQDLQSIAFRMVIYLAIFDALECIFSIFPAHLISPDACLIQSLALEFFGFGSILWAGFICLSLYLQVYKNYLITLKYVKNCLIITVILCIFDSLPIYLTHHYGYIGGFCLINDDYQGKLLKFYIFYIPSWTIIFAMIFFYSCIVKKINSQAGPIVEIENEAKELVSKIKNYPLIAIITLLPFTICRLTQIYFQSTWLYLIAILIYGLKGFSNAVVYGLTKTVKSKIRKSLLGIEIFYTSNSVNST